MDAPQLKRSRKSNGVKHHEPSPTFAGGRYRLAIDLSVHRRASGSDQAERVVRTIKGKCAKVAAASSTGKPRQELGAHIRSFSLWSFMVFYREVDDGILVVRILHGARDITPEAFHDDPPTPPSVA